MNIKGWVAIVTGGASGIGRQAALRLAREGAKVALVDKNLEGANKVAEEIKVLGGETLALDATFIKAWSRRDPSDDGKGLSDPESRVGRDGKTYDLGYKAHLAVDVDSDMPVAAVVASAKSSNAISLRVAIRSATSRT